MKIQVKVIADSISAAGDRLTTLQLAYHRFFHAEVMTHRVFSRNASSSRAIPVRKILSQVWNDPAMPVEWGANVAGMQAGWALPRWKRGLCRFLWRTSAKAACIGAWGMMKLGLHKQWANRILEPWQFIHVVLSSTEWENFGALRDHEDAQPEFQLLARMIKDAINESEPMLVNDGEWHAPYTSIAERDWLSEMGVTEVLQKVSSARCCRVSYLKHDGSLPRVQDDLLLCERLTHSVPIHASPFEHVARPFEEGVDDPKDTRNFKGWVQYRSVIERRLYQKPDAGHYTK